MALTTVGIAYSSSDRRHNYLAYTPNSGADEYARMYVKLNPFQWNMVGLPMNPENKPFAYFLLDDIFQTPPTVGTVVCRWNYFTGGYITSTYSFNSATASNEWSNPMLFWRGESFWIRPMGESSLRIQGDHPVAGTQVSLNPGQNQIALASPLRNWLNNLGLPAVSGDKISLLSSTGWKHSTYQSGGFWSPNLGVEPGQGIILTRTQNSNVTWMPSLGYQP